MRRHRLNGGAAAIALWLALASPLTQTAGAAGGFVPGLEDVPLMPGLAAAPEATTVFDKPAGRIVESYASGTGTPAEVSAFYDATLTQLGWRRVAAGQYLRRSEMLRIEVSAEDSAVTVRFALAPR